LQTLNEGLDDGREGSGRLVYSSANWGSSAEDVEEGERTTCQSSLESVVEVEVEFEALLDEQADGVDGLKFHSRRQRWICEILELSVTRGKRGRVGAYVTGRRRSYSKSTISGSVLCSSTYSLVIQCRCIERTSSMVNSTCWISMLGVLSFDVEFNFEFEFLQVRFGGKDRRGGV
jgi:hypothetical protein